jgi:Flp pilus assembly protein TadD
VSKLKTKSPAAPARKLLRYGICVLSIGCCLAGALLAARIGLSKTASKEALKSGSIAAADRAVALTPSDSDAHYARAIALTFEGEAAEAINEYERAAALRPRDYFLWLTLGTARDEAGDVEGAVAALRESVRLAPYYAQPRWQLGNVLLRAGGRQEEAFKELRRAAESNPQFLPALIDLAWSVSGNDPASVERIIQPAESNAHLALARFFLRKGRITEGLAHLRSAGNLSDKERLTLLHELMTARRYQEAYEVWLSGLEDKSGVPASGLDALIDGGFERGINLDEQAFGWRIPRAMEGLQASLDNSNHREGAQSLRLDWTGNSNPALAVAAQLVQVEPDRKYRLSFSALTTEVVSGGLPLIAITDSGGRKKLAESPPLPKATNGWTDYSVEFTTATDTRAILISVQRQPCATNPCPMFGKVWLDGFSLKRL